MVLIKAAVKKCIESEKYSAIRRDLLNQLERNGTVGEHFVDLVEDYMSLWVEKCLLRDDIHKRGVNVKYDNGGGQKGVKRNDSIVDQLKVSTQMLALLNALGIKPSQEEGEDDDPL